MLVESSDAKIPPTKQLGTSENVLRSNTKGNGYVSRNIRLSLLSADLVQPYLVIREVNELEISDDLIPLMGHEGHDREEVQKHRAVSVPANSRKVIIQWNVGGALTIDSTELYYAKWDDIPADKLNDCVVQPKSLDEVKEYMKRALPVSTSETSGTGPFNPQGPSAPFVATVDITEGFSENDKLVVLATARVDQDWAEKPDKVNPDLPPQSHIVNARTNLSWHYESEGKIVEGRLDWFSAPLTLVLRKPNSGDVEAIELSTRFPPEGQELSGDIPTKSGGSASVPSFLDRAWWILVLVAAVLLIFLAGRAYLSFRMRQDRRSRVRELIGDEAAPTPGLRNGGGQRKERNGYSDVRADSELEMGEYT